MRRCRQHLCRDAYGQDLGIWLGLVLRCAGCLLRCLGLPILLLCSTDDPITKSTWKSLGFVFTTDEDMKVRSLQYELENIKRVSSGFKI